MDDPPSNREKRSPFWSQWTIWFMNPIFRHQRVQFEIGSKSLYSSDFPLFQNPINCINCILIAQYNFSITISLRIQICPKTPGIPRTNPMTWGWDVSTINPTKNPGGVWILRVYLLVYGFNPFEIWKILVKLDHLPRVRDENKKYIWNYHLVYHHLWFRTIRLRDGALGPATAVPDVPEAEDVPWKGGKTIVCATNTWLVRNGSFINPSRIHLTGTCTY